MTETQKPTPINELAASAWLQRHIDDHHELRKFPSACELCADEEPIYDRIVRRGVDAYGESITVTFTQDQVPEDETVMAVQVSKVWPDGDIDVIVQDDPSWEFTLDAQAIRLGAVMLS